MSVNPYEFDAPGAEWDRVIVTINNSGKKGYYFAKADYTAHDNLLKMSQKLDNSNKYYLPRMFINPGHKIQFADKKDDTPENRQLLEQEQQRIKLEHQKFIEQNIALRKSGKNPYGSSFDDMGYTHEEQEDVILDGLPPPSLSEYITPKDDDNFQRWVDAQSNLSKETKVAMKRHSSAYGYGFGNTYGD